MSEIRRLISRQKQYMDDDVYLTERKRIHDSWFDESTTDFWRHKRMYETIRPFATAMAESSWLTVGDGRFGLDAIRLQKLFGLTSVFPTDIGENMLKESQRRGLIADYGVENAESLSFADDSFDVVFCKESFHHFPRPYQALYEMLRVCRKAVVLIEPAEAVTLGAVKSKDYLLSAVRLLWAKIRGRAYNPHVPSVNPLDHSFEEAGNYVYGVSVRELEKLVHGMALGGLAWKGINDVYIKSCEFEEAKEGAPIFDQINSLIAEGDRLCRKRPHMNQPNMVSAIIFKSSPDPALANDMGAAGFYLPMVHKNPFTTKAGF